jgi:DivIVA domain-containing protein
VIGNESPESDETGSGQTPDDPAETRDSSERRNVASEVGDVSFPVSVRGYDRGAVDAYVIRVQQLVAELELTRSPEGAVKHALEQVGEQTKGILEGAGDTAEQITVAAREGAEETTARARREAEDIVANEKATAAETLAPPQAEAEATVAQAQKDAVELLQRSQDEVAALRVEAEARMRELQADTETIHRERSQLLADLRGITTRVEEVASAADARFSPEETEEANVESGTAAEATATEVMATEKPNL